VRSRESRVVLIGRKVAEVLDEDGVAPPHLKEMPSGALVDPLDPDPELVFIEDVAHCLARIARFAGCVETYVVNHALIVAGLLLTEGRSARVVLHGLLHDAHEAYLGDVVRPLKYKPEMAFYREACDRVQATIYRALGLPDPTEEEAEIVKRADDVSLVVEARAGLPSRGEHWRMSADIIRAAANYSLLMQEFERDHDEMERKFLREYWLYRREAGL
jgi:5'-deoxynucleotidase YfbR-like HD superfamily hydrolase